MGFATQFAPGIAFAFLPNPRKLAKIGPIKAFP